MQSVQNQIQTKQGPPKHDDSYQGKRVTVLSLTMHNIAQYYFFYVFRVIGFSCLCFDSQATLSLLGSSQEIRWKVSP